MGDIRNKEKQSEEGGKETVAGLLEELKTAQGSEPADLLIHNVRILDVFTRSVYEGDILIRNGRICAINPSWDMKAKETFNGQGLFAVPGFMDAHVHIETTLLSPEALSDATVPWGSTTLFVDAMEIANVAGLAGLRAMLNTGDDLPFRIFMEIPSRVPTAPGLETTGGVLGVEEVKELLQEDNAVSLGELDPSKILGLKTEYLEKILAARNQGKICNGHAIGLNWDELNMYAAAGMSDCHESVEFDELFARLRLGVKALIREGSSERNLEALVSGVVREKLPTNNLMFCTDDKHVNDIFEEGHISYNIQRAIELGVPPIEAIQMATINTAQHFRVDHLIGSIAPNHYADIVLLKSLDEIKPEYVFKGGKLVAQRGRLLESCQADYPEFLYHTVTVDPGFCAKQLEVDVPAACTEAQVHVIELCQDQIINTETNAWLPVKEQRVQPDVSRDILKIAVVERYGKNGQVGTGFVTGFGLKKGALASSVSHDHHNIVVVGCNDADMELAVRECERLQGGFVAASDGCIDGALALPIGGLMSPLTAQEVMQAMNELNAVAAGLGTPLHAPFMSLSFVSLPTVPELGLTDKGLIDVKAHSIIPLILDTRDCTPD